MASGEEPCEYMERSQSRVAGRDAVRALALERGQEADDSLDGEVCDIEAVDRALGIARAESQEDHDGVAIASHRMGTQATLRRQVLVEEGQQCSS
jgi:hypothetical protein